MGAHADAGVPSEPDVTPSRLRFVPGRLGVHDLASFQQTASFVD
jgi:hypothetical protein